jgi:hypothetical protein
LIAIEGNNQSSIDSFNRHHQNGGPLTTGSTNNGELRLAIPLSSLKEESSGGDRKWPLELTGNESNQTVSLQIESNEPQLKPVTFEVQTDAVKDTNNNVGSGRCQDDATNHKSSDDYDDDDDESDEQSETDHDHDHGEHDERGVDDEEDDDDDDAVNDVVEEEDDDQGEDDDDEDDYDDDMEDARDDRGCLLRQSAAKSKKSVGHSKSTHFLRHHPKCHLFHHQPHPHPHHPTHHHRPNSTPTSKYHQRLTGSIGSSQSVAKQPQPHCGHSRHRRLRLNSNTHDESNFESHESVLNIESPHTLCSHRTLVTSYPVPPLSPHSPQRLPIASNRADRRPILSVMNATSGRSLTHHVTTFGETNQRSDLLPSYALAQSNDSLATSTTTAVANAPAVPLANGGSTSGSARAAAVHLPTITMTAAPSPPTSKGDWSFLFDPSGRLCYYWSMIVSLAFLYNFWVIIYRFAFEEISASTMAIWLTLDSVADLIYVLDIGFHFRTGFLEEGVLQADALKLRQHYMNSTMFYVDCLCLLPLDFLYLSIGFFSILRAFRLVKIYRFWSFLDRTERHSNYPNLFRMGSLTHYILVTFHWNACLYHLVWRRGLFANSRESTCSDPQCDYLHAFYSSTLALTITGDFPRPSTKAEYLFLTLELLCGLFLFAAVLGHVAIIVANVSAARKEFQGKLLILT